MKTSTKIRFSLIILPIIICFSMTSRSDDPRVGKITGQLNLFNEKCSQQKVYLHTDKDVYLAGETMWIKAYFLDASMLLADTLSKEVYVELLDMNQNSVNKIILRNKQGFSNGDVLLKDTLKEGNYQLRAYTSWMRNFDGDYFFFKAITIKNPNYENVVTQSRLKELIQFNKNIKSKESEYFVSFFPEGGNLVAGKQSNIAFKAETALGTPLDIKGSVLDDKGNQITDFQSIHDGMGVFKLTPNPEVKYTAKVTFANGLTQNYTLPQTLQKGTIMRVDISSKMIYEFS